MLLKLVEERYTDTRQWRFYTNNYRLWVVMRKRGAINRALTLYNVLKMLTQDDLVASNFIEWSK